MAWSSAARQDARPASTGDASTLQCTVQGEPSARAADRKGRDEIGALQQNLDEVAARETELLQQVHYMPSILQHMLMTAFCRGNSAVFGV